MKIILAANPAKAHSIVQRAMRQVGRKGYHLAFNNCEHFAKYCATGIRTSAQFNRAAVVVSLLCMLAGLSGGVAGEPYRGQWQRPPQPTLSITRAS